MTEAKRAKLVTLIIKEIRAGKAFWLLWRGGGPKHVGDIITSHLDPEAYPQGLTICGKSGTYAWTTSTDLTRILCASCRMIIISMLEPGGV